jgi:phosphoribosylaminoimidazole-succinocarboxamide synthase
VGSVKDLRVEVEATEEAFGSGEFVFSDDYSVFDYGKMPDAVPYKGQSLCMIAAYNFQELEKLGVKSHFLEYIAPNKMRVKLVRVLYPQQNELNKGMKNYLVPLEVIFRNSLPQGSSVFARIEKGKLDWQALGLTEKPQPGQRLEQPLIDMSTKLEETDRYLSLAEARELSFLPDETFDQLFQNALEINRFINKKAEEIGLEHADGKVEFGLNPDGELILVDVCGTLDEDRMLLGDFHVSKQVMRDYYKTTPWYEAIESAKDSGLPKNEWPAPPTAPKELIDIVSNMYKSFCEAWTGERIWSAPTIDEVVQSYKAFLEKQQ